MAPWLFGGVFIVLLGLRTVSADYSCTDAPSPPVGTYCGTVGAINDFDYFDGDLVDTGDLTPEGCAATCAATEGCLSFLIEEGNFCELQSGTLAQVEFVPNSGSYYQGYDISCLVCANPSTSSSAPPSSTTTSPASSTIPVVIPTVRTKLHGAL